MADVRAKEVAEEYLSSLTDLNINSKPLITMLTMLAEENIEYASVIVETIDKQIQSVAPDFKLPILYLIDSIVKNIKTDEYRSIFTRKIANLFCDVFQKVNERTREKMYTLRQTWNDVFPAQKLYVLDVKVRHIDPGWPITAVLPVSQKPAIHVNPKFFQNRTTDVLTAELQKKQMELMQLEKKKQELENVVLKKTESVQKLNRVPMVGEQPVPISSLPPIPKIKPSDRDPRLAKQQQQQQASRRPPKKENNQKSAENHTKKTDSKRTKTDSNRNRDPRQLPRDPRSRSNKNTSGSSSGSSNAKNGTSPKSPRDKKRPRSPSSRPLKRSREKSPDPVEVKQWTKRDRKQTKDVAAKTESKPTDIDLRVQVPPKEVDQRANAIPVETMEISDTSEPETESHMDFFGKDTDLRTMNAVPPAPRMLSQHSRGAKSSSNSLQEVRAKLAEVSKQKDRLGRPLLYNQLPNDPAERKRKVAPSATGDIDLRQSLRLVDNEEDMNQSMNIIIQQAQEELQNNTIDANQFKDLVQQVWTMNETQKLRQVGALESPTSSKIEMPVLVNPWVPQPPQMPAVPPIPPMLPVKPVAPDTVRTIQIDSIPRDIRFYDEVAVIFMSNDDPRRIGFENGTRQLTISGADPMLLNFNDDYKPIIVNGKIHQIRFGAPSRELYIDTLPYECFFGGPALAVLIDGMLHSITVDGPEPKVKIGDSCKDLVAGKVQMIIDGVSVIPIYLDSKIQMFEYDQVKHTLQMADFFATVIIDGVPLSNVDYGGLPRGFKLGNKKCFIRFSTLPKGISVGQPVAQQPAIPELAPIDVPSAAPPLKLDDLLHKLLSSGLIQKSQEPASVKPVEEHVPKKKHHDVRIDLDRPSTIKKRNSAAVEALFSGMQCSSCGVRFPPEQTMKYSQHLDWHFRQNRRDRDASKRAHSRKWYYDLNDWVQYEEIEDLEEREQNWFEKHGNDVEDDDLESPNSPKIATCIAGPKGADETCEVCHDKFECFFNEESEDWHLKNAMRAEDKTFHPTCYEDQKAVEERALQNESKTEEIKDESMEDPNEEEYVPEDTKLEEMDEDFDDDVIALPPEKTIITEIIDDEDNENGYRLNEIEDTSIDSPMTVEPKKSAQVEVVKEVEEVMDTTEIKVKEEKLDDSYNDPFEDVGTLENEPDSPLDLDDDGTTNDEQFTSISILNEDDSNSPRPTNTEANLSMAFAPPTTTTVNKIRINITKPMSHIAPEQKDDELTSVEPDEPVIEVEPTFTVKPSMAGIKFNKMPKRDFGTEASGLCSIM